MGRPPLALGTFGALRFYRTDNGWRVRTYVRDPDGKTREVERRGRTKNAAAQALKTALRDRSNHGGTTQEITQTTKVRGLAESWFAEFAGNGNALNTIQLYRDRLDRQVIPSLGGLYVHELTPSVIDRQLRAVAATNGPGTAKTTRSVLSGMCAFAVRCDALRANPVRDLSRISAKPRASRALSVFEARQLLAWITYSDYALNTTYRTFWPFSSPLVAASAKLWASHGTGLTSMPARCSSSARRSAAKVTVCVSCRRKPMLVSELLSCPSGAVTC
jgi:hypothetical protein